MTDKELLRAILNFYGKGKGQSVARGEIVGKLQDAAPVAALEAAFAYLCQAKIMMAERDRQGGIHYRLTSDRPYSMINEAHPRSR